MSNAYFTISTEAGTSPEEPHIDWSAIAADLTLPLTVRAAAQFGLNGNAVVPDRAMIESAVADSDTGSPWQSFYEAYTSTTWWKDHFRDICRAAPKGKKIVLMGYLDIDIEKDRPSPEFLELLVEVARDPATNAINRFVIQVLLAGVGISDFLDQATEQLNKVTTREIHFWIGEAPYFPGAIASKGIEILKRRRLSASDQMEMVGMLGHFAMSRPTGVKRNLLAAGPFLKRDDTSELALATIGWVTTLLRRRNVTPRQKVELESILVRCGSDSALRRLISHLEEYLETHTRISNKDWSWFAGALFSFLFEHEDIKTEFLWKIIDRGRDQPVSAVMEGDVPLFVENSSASMLSF